MAAATHFSRSCHMRLFSRRRSASAASKPVAAGKLIPAAKGYSLLDAQLSVTGDLETTG